LNIYITLEGEDIGDYSKKKLIFSDVSIQLEFKDKFKSPSAIGIKKNRKLESKEFKNICKF
jgi:hypothetical protein